MALGPRQQLILITSTVARVCSAIRENVSYFLQASGKKNRPINHTYYLDLARVCRACMGIWLNLLQASGKNDKKNNYAEYLDCSKGMQCN